MDEHREIERLVATGYSRDYNILYLIRQLDTDFIKIGICLNGTTVKHRMTGLQGGNPNHLFFERIYRVEHAEPIEQFLHRKYTSKDKHILGEWFLLNKCDVKRIDKLIRKENGRMLWPD